MNISKIKIPKKINCSKFKNFTSCNNQEQCIWNNSMSNNKMTCTNNISTLFDEYVRIVRTKSGKNMLVTIAKELHVSYIGRDIKSICNDIQQLLHVAMHGNTIATIANKLHIDITTLKDSEIYYRIYKYIFDKLIESNHDEKYTDITHRRQIISSTRDTYHLSHKSAIIPGYIDYDKHKVLYKNEFSFAKRIEYVNKINEILKNISNEDYCNFKKGFEKIKRIGTRSAAGEVFVGYNSNSTLPTYVAIKMMPVKEANYNEIKCSKFFTTYVLNNISPHFPVMYGSKKCSSCNYDDKRRYKGDCLLLLNELAEGDLKVYLKTPRNSYELLCTFGQIIMTCLGIEHAGLVHNDMHWGNYLYHKVPEYNGKYFHYRYFDTNSRIEHNIYLKNNGYVFIGWDFADAYPPKYSNNDTLNIDVYRIFHINKWALEEGYPIFPDFASNICTLLKQASRDSTYGVFGLLKYFNSLLYQPNVGKRMQQILLIDPPIAPSIFKVINKKPYELPL